MLQELARRISVYKKNLFNFEDKEKKGLILLEKKSPDANIIINKLYEDAKEIIKSDSTEKLNKALKETLKNILLKGKVGAILIKEDKIVIRGASNEESNEELLFILMQTNENVAMLIYHSTYDYLVQKINIEFLSIESILNLKNLETYMVHKLIEIVFSYPEIKQRLKDTSIEVDTLKSKSSFSYKKFHSLVTELIKSNLDDASSPIYEAIADFLIRSIANASHQQLKYMKEFFDHKINDKNSRKKQINFAIIRRNAVDREKYLKLIDEANKKIEDAKKREGHFVRIEEEGKKELITIQKQATEARKAMEKAHIDSKNAFDKREIIRKQPNGMKSNKYKELSDAVRNYALRKSSMDIEVKNLQKKLAVTKQSIDNAIEDRADYVKLLPEMVSVQTKKIRDYKYNLREFQADYNSAKGLIIDRFVTYKK